MRYDLGSMLTLSAGSLRIGIASLLLLAAMACSRSKGPEGQGMRMMDAVPVSVAAVQKKTVPVQLTGIGNVEAFSTVSIKSQVGGELLPDMAHVEPFHEHPVAVRRRCGVVKRVVEGGVPLVVGGELVGAIGVSGMNSQQDGVVAAAGVAVAAAMK